MKSYTIIEKLLSQLQYKSGLAKPDRMKAPIDEAWRRFEAEQMTLPTPKAFAWILSVGPVKLITVAAVALVGLAVSIGILDRSTSPAYAFEQTVQAVKGIRYFHFRLLDQRQNTDKEAWVEYDQDGKLKKVRVDFLGMNSVMVWGRDVTQYLKADPDELDIFKDMEYTDKILFFARRFDPRNAIEYLKKREAEGAIRIKIGEPSGQPELISVTVTYDPNTYLIGTPMPQMQEILHIDPATKLVSYINVAVYVKEIASFTDVGAWEYLDYNQPFDPNIFDLKKEIGKGTTCINTLGSDLGIEQGKMSDREIAITVAEEFLAAWKSKNYERAVQIHGYITRANRDEVLQLLNNSDLLRIVEIGDVFPSEQPMRGYCLRFTLETQQDGKTSESRWEIHVRRLTPKRWRIGKVTPLGK